MPTHPLKPRPNSYPFGSSLKTRAFSAGSGFRFGFNGKENFDQYQDYGMRIYYPGLGKFLSTDPLKKDYPWYSTYQFAGNMPIGAIDIDGLEIYFAANGNYIGLWGTSTEIRVINNENINSFKNDLNSAKNNPSDWIKQDVMDFYWSGNAGSHSPSTSDKNKITIGRVIPKSTHESYRKHKDCFKSANATLSNNNFEPGNYWVDKDYQFQMYSASNNPNVDIRKTRQAGFEKINTELEDHKPVLVGVDYEPGSSNPNTDNTTDHFIILTDRSFDESGKLFYSGFENVDGGNRENGTSTVLNRFYPNSDRTLQGGTTFHSDMTISQVRPVKVKK